MENWQLLFIVGKINADFYNILTNPSGDGKTLVRQPMDLSKAKMCLHQLAKFHAMFPDKVIRKDSNLSFFPRVSEPTYKLFKVEATKHWKNGVASNRPNGIVHEGWTYKIQTPFETLPMMYLRILQTSLHILPKVTPNVWD